MNTIEEDIENLEALLDGQLSESDAAKLRDRINCESELMNTYQELQQDRLMRTSVFRSLEPDDAKLDAWADRFRAALSGNKKSQSRYWIFARQVGAVAACLLVGFLVVHALHKPGTSKPSDTAIKADAAKTYRVALLDDSGKESAVQDFSSPEAADAFAKDLKQWQDRQRNLHDGAIIPVSDRF